LSTQTPTNLLRLLEPAVRPDGVAGRAPGAAPPQQTVEGQDFATLLQQAQGTGSTQPNAAADDTDQTAQANQPADRANQPTGRTNPLAQLSGIDNPSVLRIAGRMGQDGDTPDESQEKGV